MRLIFFFAGLLVLISGCKKYPEGGRINTATGTEQRIEGNYTIESFTVNGYDSLSALTSNPNYCANLKIEFDRNSPDANIVKPSCGNPPANFWRATDDRLNIEITCTQTTGAYSLSNFLKNWNLTLYWEIKRLTKNELWMETTYNSRDYYLKLKR